MKIQEKKKLRIPYASPGLAIKAIDLFRRMSLQKITSKFIVDNGFATKPNAFKIMDLLMWLGIIDMEGNVNNDIARKLKLVGKDRDDFIINLIKKSYAELFEALDLMKVNRDDIINFIVNHYGFGQAQAKYAAILFLHFCQTYGIEISDELKKRTYKFSERKKGERKKAKKSKEPTDLEISTGNIAVIIKAPNVNYPFYAKNKDEFEEIIKKKLPIAIEGVRNSLKLLELEQENKQEVENEEQN